MTLRRSRVVVVADGGSGAVSEQASVKITIFINKNK